ncbi:MAG: hypothetical protein OEM46_12485, partial [Ignavibacteria bacterium]|nr:hypothetical protein [Ignavibacteria bacterium]
HEKVMFALEQPVPELSELTMIYIEHRQLAEACSILFYHLWDQGVDINEVGKDSINKIASFSFVSN